MFSSEYVNDFSTLRKDAESDITFCTSSCRKTDCFRHYSHRPKTGFVSVTDYKSNGKCPYKEVQDEAK